MTSSGISGSLLTVQQIGGECTPPQGRRREPDEKPRALCCNTVAVGAAVWRLAREAGDFPFRKTDLFKIRSRVFAQGRHPLSSGDVGSGHTERKVQDLELASSIAGLGKRAPVRDLRIAQCFAHRP